MKIDKQELKQIIKEELAGILSEQQGDEATQWVAQQVAKKPEYSTGRIVPGTESGEQDIRDRLENLKDIENAMDMTGARRAEDIPDELAVMMAKEVALAAAGGLASRAILSAFPKIAAVVNRLGPRKGFSPPGAGLDPTDAMWTGLGPHTRALPGAAQKTAEKAARAAKQVRYKGRPYGDSALGKALHSDVRPFRFVGPDWKTAKLTDPSTWGTVAKGSKPGSGYAPSNIFGPGPLRGVGGQAAKPQIVPAYLPFTSVADDAAAWIEKPEDALKTPKFIPPLLPEPEPTEEELFTDIFGPGDRDLYPTPVRQPRRELEPTPAPPKPRRRPRPKPAPLTVPTNLTQPEKKFRPVIDGRMEEIPPMMQEELSENMGMPLPTISWMPEIQWTLDKAMDTGGEELLRSEAERIKNIDVYANAANRDEIFEYIDNVVRVRTEKGDLPHVKTTVGSWRGKRHPSPASPLYAGGE